MNYFLDDRINRAEILFPGVGCFLIAVCLGSIVHASNADDNKSKLSHYYNNNTDEGYSFSLFLLVEYCCLVILRFFCKIVQILTESFQGWF